MTERLVASGNVLAGRYVLADLVSDSLGALHWRAHDRVLKRNVGVELLPRNDARADHFLAAAKDSTLVKDHRFLQVLDVLDDEDGYCAVVREWAKATSLDNLLRESPLTNERAAGIVAEVASAFAGAHAEGIYHRRLAPHHILLKQTGAVRIVGLGVADALAPPDHEDTPDDLLMYERIDVQSLGKLLYACIVSRWPGGSVDGLRPAPTEHGRLMHPRQVRAGVSRELDMLCGRILDPGSSRPLLKAGDVARELWRTPVDQENSEPIPLISGQPDVLRTDPVVLPSGPPPGLEPPRRRPKAFTPPEPTAFERGMTRVRESTRGGDRALIIAGVIGTLVLLMVLLGLVVVANRSKPGSIDTSSSAAMRLLRPDSITDFDPQGQDKGENPDQAKLAIDGKESTGWRTADYYRFSNFGNLKDGVGLIVDLGAPKQVERVSVSFGGRPTSFSLLTGRAGLTEPPKALADFSEQRQVNDAGTKSMIVLPRPVVARYVLVWLRSVPEVGPSTYRGEIREITIEGR